MARHLKIDQNHPDPGPIRQARNTLAQGGLVIVPTETVYGLACDPTVEGALDRLASAKGRDGVKPVARLAADIEQVRASARTWTPGLQALAERFWPGPLTIVLETHQEWTGFRIPDHAVTQALARTCPDTLALTSANLSGTPDTKSAEEAAAAVEADLVLDSGPTAAEAIPSTVIKINGNTIECLREGHLPFSKIQAVHDDAMEKKQMILFVCTGNTCRSPMAEALFNKRSDPASGWKATSAGLYAAEGEPASRHAVEALKQAGIEFNNHQSKQLTAELVEQAALIVPMTEAHAFHILQDHPHVGAKVCLIKSFGTSKVPADICDPFGGSLDIYIKTRDEIDQALSDLILFIREETEHN